jgi:hypothetical protein
VTAVVLLATIGPLASLILAVVAFLNYRGGKRKQEARAADAALSAVNKVRLESAAQIAAEYARAQDRADRQIAEAKVEAIATLERAKVEAKTILEEAATVRRDVEAARAALQVQERAGYDRRLAELEARLEHANRQQGTA